MALKKGEPTGANLAANSAYSYLTDPFGLSLDVTNLGLSFSPEFTLPGAIDRGIEIFNFLDDAGLINH